MFVSNSVLAEAEFGVIVVRFALCTVVIILFAVAVLRFPRGLLVVLLEIVQVPRREGDAGLGRGFFVQFGQNNSSSDALSLGF